MLTANSSQTIATDRGDNFVLTDFERIQIEHAIHHYAEPRAATIDALKIVQSQRRWVPDGAIYAIADMLGIGAGDVEGVATFYNRIYRNLLSFLFLILPTHSSLVLYTNIQVWYEKMN